MEARRIALVRKGNSYVADTGGAHCCRDVFVSNARAVRRDGPTANLLIVIPASIPRAAEWVVSRDKDSVYVNPPEAGLHWASHTIQVVAPRQHQLRINDQM